MSKKKNKRLLSLLGKRKYDFDITFEKQIYSCLCCSYGAKKAFKKLDAKYKFNSYHEWRQYICNKYKSYHKDELIEFSRYLNQNMRNIRPLQESWDLFVSIILTVLFTIGADKLLNFHLDIKGSLLDFVIIYLLLLMFFVSPILLLVRQIIIPIFDNNIEENFFKDYREIIDDMISKR